MAQIGDLHDELLTTIFILLVTTCDGATTLARLTATCKKFQNLATESAILRAVNFQSIRMNKYEAHHHPKDLFYLCARAKNLGAEARIGKALLHNDIFFWNLILEHDKPLASRTVPPLHHEKLVRSFIVDASNTDLAGMHMPLLSYSVSFLGYDVARACGIMLAVGQMCNYYIDEIQGIKKLNLKLIAQKEASSAMARLTRPSTDAFRANLLAKFDEMFPNSRERALEA